MALPSIALPERPAFLRANEDLDEYFTQVEAALSDLAETLQGRLRFGDARHPDGTAQHPNGYIENLEGSFVTVTWQSLDTAVTCQHNLDLSTNGTANTNPNVNWLVMGTKHNGTGANVNDSLSVVYEEGDTIDADSIELRLYTGGTRTVNVANPVTMVLWFTAADPY